MSQNNTAGIKSDKPSILFARPQPARVPTTAELEAMVAAMNSFYTDEEVKFAIDCFGLAPILNTLTERGVKFYLVHLPGGAGWILRRHRPTGVFNGTVDPRTVSAAKQGGACQSSGSKPGDRCFAEEYFGTGGLRADNPPTDKVCDPPANIQQRLEDFRDDD
ncbi:MAG: hypothetical protein DDT26_00017 [Dehalococcoidia bacterium]|nr:hypothetical protein [Chloroflexota bacterium]